MATKKTRAVPKKDPNVLRITGEKDKSRERQFAELGLSATALNAITARTFAQWVMGEIDLTESVTVMREKAGKVNSGDTSELEATLTAQAVSLDTIFSELARRAALNMGEHLHATESYMRLALKAQAQCARTIEVLATIKNPPIVYARQANVTTGPQQVNNGVEASRVREIENHQTQLSGVTNELLPDARASGIESQVNSALETVGEIDRAEVRRG